MKFTFTLTEQGWEREKQILESRSGESLRHISLKILSYLLYRGEATPYGLQIERKVGQRHKPDLVAMEVETGLVRLWIDCGQIETERLGRIVAKNPQSRIIVVKSTEQEARLYGKAAFRELPIEAEARSRVAITGFDTGFIQRFGDALRGTNQLALERPIVLDKTFFTFKLNTESFSTGHYTFTADSLE